MENYPNSDLYAFSTSFKGIVIIAETKQILPEIYLNSHHLRIFCAHGCLKQDDVIKG